MSSQLTVAEAADLLGVPGAEVHRLIATGRLEHQLTCSGRCELLVSLESVMAVRAARTA
ncbi:MAG: hypothetical protein PGN07_01210 [Aeromicrobium erythreum]